MRKENGKIKDFSLPFNILMAVFGYFSLFTKPAWGIWRKG